MATGRHQKEGLDERFAEHPRRRGRRAEVVEILAEGLWTLVCGGRGPGRCMEPQPGEKRMPPPGCRVPTSDDAATD